MCPHPKRDEIEALHSRLCKEPMDSEANSSIEELNIRPDECIELRCTRSTSRQIVSPQPPAMVAQPP